MDIHTETTKITTEQDMPNEGRRNMMKMTGAGIVALGISSLASSQAFAQSSIALTDEWDKKFAKSDKVDHKKSHFQKPLWHYPCC
ncbi:twin-arginine translocation signal domain-containing protein [Shewanella vesiculosa]|nr:twin-arginine translocation signal domain-containing protein [Shewanella vesiculosa]UJL43804.1 twin-arginine translocation signal domain-containing protein [Shewanella vesiculosa]